MKASDECLALIEYFEGMRFEAYICPAGVLTIGVGHVGSEVKPGLVWTQEQINKALRDDLKKCEATIGKVVRATLLQRHFDALCSLIFNIGSGNFESSTLLKYLNSGHYEIAAGQFLRWDKAAGKRMAGLTKRREAEKAMFEGRPWRDTIR